VEHVSKNDAIGPVSGELIVDARVTYSDIGHWNSYGEDIFGKRLVHSMRQDLARRNMLEARFFGWPREAAER